jgi:hypothetical protein
LAQRDLSLFTLCSALPSEYRNIEKMLHFLFQEGTALHQKVARKKVFTFIKKNTKQWLGFYLQKVSLNFCTITVKLKIPHSTPYDLPTIGELSAYKYSSSKKII